MPAPRGLVARACGLALALGSAAGLCSCDDRKAASCLPAARADGEAESIPLPADGAVLRWYCADPPPATLLDGSYRTDLIWVEGEPCDPCDLERIASVAGTQVCAGAGPEPVPLQPLRLLCGPVPYPLQPWDRKGCVYAVASDAGPICD